jgi:hypothetical protein
VVALTGGTSARDDAGDDAAAVAWYDRAIVADPRAVEPRINLGLLHRRHHRIDAAAAPPPRCSDAVSGGETPLLL